MLDIEHLLLHASTFCALKKDLVPLALNLLSETEYLADEFCGIDRSNS